MLAFKRSVTMSLRAWLKPLEVLVIMALPVWRVTPLRGRSSGAVLIFADRSHPVFLIVEILRILHNEWRMRLPSGKATDAARHARDDSRILKSGPSASFLALSDYALFGFSQ